MAVVPNPQKRLGIMPVKPITSSGTPNLEKMPTIIRTPSPGNMSKIKSNGALAARQRKMIDAMKANGGKMNNKSKINIQKAAMHRKKRKGGVTRQLFSGSIG